MVILIDYDNMDRQDLRRGCSYVVGRLLNILGPDRVAGLPRVNCRLYGGWYSSGAHSPQAARLLPLLRRDFPRSVLVGGSSGTLNVLVHADLARSIACDPVIPITHTYRERSIPKALACRPSPFPMCSMPAECPLKTLSTFMHDHECPTQGCPVEPHSVFYQAQQKLVDSMLIVDMLHFARTTEVVIVSADDDLWPGIRFALLQGAEITHIIPRNGRGDLNRYLVLPTDKYSRLLM